MTYDTTEDELEGRKSETKTEQIGSASKSSDEPTSIVDDNLQDQHQSQDDKNGAKPTTSHCKLSSSPSTSTMLSSSPPSIDLSQQTSSTKPALSSSSSSDASSVLSSLGEKRFDFGTKVAEKSSSLSSAASSDSSPTSIDNNNEKEITSSTNEIDEDKVATSSTTTTTNEDNCCNQVLNNEIRNRLDKLNALSDLINSLERQFDEANLIFRETLKCSTDRLSTIARILGSKSIKYGRNYHAARLTVEQNQSECQRACVQFEQANNDHQSAKLAIREAEQKLRDIAGQDVGAGGKMASRTDTTNETMPLPLTVDVDNLSQQRESLNIKSQDEVATILDVNKLRLTEIEGIDYRVVGGGKMNANGQHVMINQQHGNSCDTNNHQGTSRRGELNGSADQHETKSIIGALPATSSGETKTTRNLLKDAAKLSEELNQAISRLVEAERKRGISQRQHLDQTNRLMVAQENLMRLEREHGQSIKRSQLYFDEARRFDARLNSVKGEISRISDEIVAAKQAYAETLRDLERFSEEIHVTTNATIMRDQQVRD